MATNDNSSKYYVSESVTACATVTLRHKWTIVNFNDLPTNCAESAVFSSPYCNDQWLLRLKKVNWTDSKGYFVISLCLRSCESKDRIAARFSLSLVDVNGCHRFTKSATEMVIFFAENHTTLGIVREQNDNQIVVRKNALLAYGSTILGSENKLQVFCTVSLFGDTRCISKVYSETKLYSSAELDENSFQKDVVAWINRVPPEVQIQTSDGFLFRAHKIVLQSRSPSFCSIISSRSEVSNVIPTEFNSQVMKALLEFMYTDSVAEIDCFADELLTAAEKYNLQKLKKKCEEVLVKSVTTRNAGHLLSIADACGAIKLKEKILDYIACNARTVCTSDEWQTQVDKPELFKETMQAVFKKRKI